MKNLSISLILIKIFTLLIIASLITMPAIAQKKTVKTSKKWAIELSLKSGYDNNALRYSEKYLERFKNNQDEGRFHIKKYDDLIFNYSGRISYSDRLIKKMLSVFSAKFDYNQYTFNTIKTWSQIDLTYQQYVTQKTSLMFSYAYIPEFYVAHFRDNDWVKVYGYTPITFQPFTFSKNDFGFTLQQNFNPDTRARIYFSLAKYYYNQHFIEYDSDNYSVGARIFHNISSKFSIDAGYKFLRSNAKGYDEPGENKINSDDADATYNEHNINLGLGYQLPKLFNKSNKLSLSVNVYKRNYLTEKTIEEDQLHSGRNDFSYRITLTYDVNLISNLKTGLYFNYAYRDAESSNSLNNEFISDEKDYDQIQVGLNILYKFRF